MWGLPSLYVQQIYLFLYLGRWLVLGWVSQKYWQQNSLGRNQMPEHFWRLFCVTGTPPWLLRPVKVSTSSELYPDMRLLFFFFECLGIQFFLTCDLWDAMPLQRSLALLPKEAEDFPRGEKHFKRVPLLTYLIYLSPKELSLEVLFKVYGW